MKKFAGWSRTSDGCCFAVLVAILVLILNPMSCGASPPPHDMDDGRREDKTSPPLSHNGREDKMSPPSPPFGLRGPGTQGPQNVGGDHHQRRHREEDKSVRRGKDATKGATVIFWRLAGGEEEELLALRLLLFVFVAIFLFLLEVKNDCEMEDIVAAPRKHLRKMDNEWSTNRR